MIDSLIHSMIICPDNLRNYPKIEYGKGVFLYDDHGKEYLDASSGAAAVSNLGYGIEEVGEILRKQSSKVSVLPTHVFSSQVVEEYLDTLKHYASHNFSRVWTVMSGTEAVENAVKLSLQYHKLRGDDKRYKIISRNSSYHGNSIFMLDVGGMKLRKEFYHQWMKDFPHISPANMYRKPEGVSERDFVNQLVAEFEQVILENDPETCAALIVEPVVAAALGAVPPPKGYFEKLKELSDYYGMLFIVDEVMTGFGRTGTKFGFENFNIIPDIIAAGKGISAGYFPLSAVIASQKVMEPFEFYNNPFLGGHTFACNPMGAAVGQFVIEYMEKNNIVEHSLKQGNYLSDKLKTLYKHDIVGDIRGVGMMLGIELVKDKQTKEPFDSKFRLSKKIGEIALEKGVVLYPGGGTMDGEKGDHILITPPLTISQSECDRIVDVLDESIRDVFKLV